MNIDKLIDGIVDSYGKYGLVNRNESENFPNRENVVNALLDIQSLIFPGFREAEDINQWNIRYVTGQKVNSIITTLTKEIQKALIYTSNAANGHTDNKSKIENSHCFKLAEQTALALIEEIPEIRRMVALDTKAAFLGDPAAKSNEEIILSYPGLQAIMVHRIAHFLHKNGVPVIPRIMSEHVHGKTGVPVIPRIMSEHVHGKTGVDIHPGATIGESFFIDHATGVVIGETCVIGNNVKIYQGVTLGALSVAKTMQNTKRHPTIEDNVTIYANATILGGETVIGKGAIIGGNTWVTKSVEPGKTVYN